MSKRISWLAATAAVCLALFSSAHGTRADATSAAVLYRSNGTALGLAVINSTGSTAQLQIILKGAAPDATYSVAQCAPDPLGGTPGCNSTPGSFTTDDSGSATYNTPYTRGWGTAIIIVTNTSFSFDSGTAVVSASPDSLNNGCGLGLSIFGIVIGGC